MCCLSDSEDLKVFGENKWDGSIWKELPAGRCPVRTIHQRCPWGDFEPFSTFFPGWEFIKRLTQILTSFLRVVIEKNYTVGNIHFYWL